MDKEELVRRIGDGVAKASHLESEASALKEYFFNLKKVIEGEYAYCGICGDVVSISEARSDGGVPVHEICLIEKIQGEV